MPQPIPRKIKTKNPELDVKPYNTLLVDGSNLLEIAMVNEKTNTNGKHIGGIVQFLVMLKGILQKGNFDHAYVFWDGLGSGQLRYNLYSEYKANRDKTFEEEGLSDYMKEVNARIQKMYRHFNKDKAEEKKRKKELFHEQRAVLMLCFEELFVRQCLCDKVEADDFIGYYVSHKEPNEKIVIVSTDRDLTQLINDDVIVYLPTSKTFLNAKNHISEMGYHHENVVLKKILCGDSSDNIKGIKGLGEKTLFDNFDGFKSRRMTLEEVIDGAKKINEERLKSKKKPLKWAENIINRVTDGVQGERIYEINERIIDLKNPLMTDEGKELIDNFIHKPIDPDDRNMENLYRILVENGVDDFMDTSKFSNFFVDYKYLIDKEKKFFEKS